MTEHDLYRQVVFIWRLVCFITEGLLMCCLYLQGGPYLKMAVNTDFIKDGLSKCDLYLEEDLCSEVAINTGCGCIWIINKLLFEKMKLEQLLIFGE